MSHAIEVWRAVLSTPRTLLTLLPAQEDELPGPDEGDEAVVELTRQYPGLSRALAEYLAR
jgi:hypothetical protein